MTSLPPAEVIYSTLGRRSRQLSRLFVDLLILCNFRIRLLPCAETRLNNQSFFVDLLKLIHASTNSLVPLDPLFRIVGEFELDSIIL